MMVFVALIRLNEFIVLMEKSGKVDEKEKNLSLPADDCRSPTKLLCLCNVGGTQNVGSSIDEGLPLFRFNERELPATGSTLNGAPLSTSASRLLYSLT